MTEQKQAKTQATPFGEFVLAVKMAFYKRETPEHMKRFCAVNETMAKAVNEYSALCAIADAAERVFESLRIGISQDSDYFIQERDLLRSAIQDLAKLRS